MRSEGPSRSEDAGLGAYRFTIAVVADTHLNEAEYGSSSPYECNRVANARTRWVIEALNRARPELVIHLGDLVHPVPTLPGYADAARNFKALARGLRCPLYLVPGNHDVGDKPVVWAPASCVSEASLALWREHFGHHFYSFDFRDLHVVVIDAQIINSGLGAEADQVAWLEQDLRSAAGRRTFLCLHYPPYLAERGEEESYDNLAEPGRSWLLSLVVRYRPEAMFCGHVHNFFYNRHGATECYVLPSTAFVRQDYSELTRGTPGDEHGRNDVPKLGFALVKVYERGHVCHVVRTYGATLDPDEAVASERPRVASVHTRENLRAPLGVDLRHPWSEVIEIPPTGALDEFGRKRVRNDYPLMALWEMGIRKLRVPLQDLDDARVRERIRLLRTLGHEFTVYTLDVPRGRARDVLIEHHELIDVWEVVANIPDLDRTIAGVREVKRKAPLVACLSKLRSKEDVRREGSRYYHFINHGFVVAEREQIGSLVENAEVASVIDGIVFRVVRQASPWVDITAAAALAASLGLRACVQIRMASTNPAEAFTDDRDNANRVAEALVAAIGQCTADRPAIDVFVDTFADIDRGYFVRNGLVDRRYNPRAAGHVVRNLYGALNASPRAWEPGEAYDLDSVRICTLERAGERAILVLPKRTKHALSRLRGPMQPTAGRAARADASSPVALVDDRGRAQRVDLVTGELTTLAWQRTGDEVELDPVVACAGPTLILLNGSPGGRRP